MSLEPEKVNKKKYRAIVVGCGKIGALFELDSRLVKPASHAGSFAKNPRIELVGLVDQDTSVRKRVDSYYKVKTYENLLQCLVEQKPDIAAIATPPKTHEEILRILIDNNVSGIICEKPVSDSLSGAEKMISYTELKSSIVILNHQRRFFPLFQKARERIKNGELGEIQQATVYYTNGVFNNGTHAIDALQFLLDERIVWMSGVKNEKNLLCPPGDSNIDGLFGFENGAVATLQSLDKGAYSIHELKILGTSGILNIRQNGFYFEWVFAKSNTETPTPELDFANPEIEIDKRSMIEATTQHIVDCLDGVSTSQSTLKDGFSAVKALSALVESAESDGKKITLI